MAFGSRGIPNTCLEERTLVKCLGKMSPIPDKIANVGRGHIEIWKNAAPVADPWTDKECVPGIRKRLDLILETVLWRVAPSEHDHVLGNPMQMFWMLEDDVPPHHHAFSVLFREQFMHLENVVDIDASHTYFIGKGLGRTFSKPPYFIATHIKEGKGEVRADLGVEVVEQGIGFFSDRTEQGESFPQMGVALVSQDSFEMSKGLLIPKNIHVQEFAMGDQGFSSCGVRDPSGGPICGCFSKAYWYSM